MKDETKWVWRHRIQARLELIRGSQENFRFSQADLSELIRKRAACGPNLLQTFDAAAIRRRMGAHPKGAEAKWVIPACSMVIGRFSKQELLLIAAEEEEKEPGWIVEGGEVRMSNSKKAAIRNQVIGAQAHASEALPEMIHEDALNRLFLIYARDGLDFENECSYGEMHYAHGPDIVDDNARYAYRCVYRVMDWLGERQFAELNQYRPPEILTEKERRIGIREQLRAELACLNECDARRIQDQHVREVIYMQAQCAPNFHFAFSEDEMKRYFAADEVEIRWRWRPVARLEVVLGSLSRSELIEIADFEPEERRKKKLRRFARWGQLCEELCDDLNTRLSDDEIRALLRLCLEYREELRAEKEDPDTVAAFEPFLGELRLPYFAYRFRYWLADERQEELELFADASAWT
jgi:hypothetical protein